MISRHLRAAAALSACAAGLVAAGCDEPCHPASPPGITGEQCVAVEVRAGVPQPKAGLYDDPRPVAPGARFRALIGLPVRDREGLEQRIRDMYDRAQPGFRQFMTPEGLAAAHAPSAVGASTVSAWLGLQGFSVDRVAGNRLLIEFSGTAGQFADAFRAPLLQCERANPARLSDQVYCVDAPLQLPRVIADLVTGVVTADLPAAGGSLPGEAGDISTAPPDAVAEGYQPAQIARAYQVDALYDLGYTGQGVTLGVVAGATFRFKDVQSFWQTFGIARASPDAVDVMDPVVTRFRETTLDVEWAGAIAPGARVVVYQGPDALNTSILYTFTEAIARAEVSVLTTSFAKREDSERPLLREQYSDAAMLGAALGITIAAACGDTAETDTPSASPFVTCVGGTSLSVDAAGEPALEVAWEFSGSGESHAFRLPYWQEGIVSSPTRAVADVALHASVEPAYWIYFLQQWRRFGGTSFAAPVFAGIIAVINSYRLDQGLPPVGYLNPVLYLDPEVRAAFRDITAGSTAFFAARPGWDHPTGWGAPRALDLATRL